MFVIVDARDLGKAVVMRMKMVLVYSLGWKSCVSLG